MLEYSEIKNSFTHVEALILAVLLAAPDEEAVMFKQSLLQRREKL